jgi:hypothetical protein
MSQCTECTYYARLQKNPVEWPCAECEYGEKFQEKGTREKPKPLSVQLAERDQHIAELEAENAQLRACHESELGVCEQHCDMVHRLTAEIAEKKAENKRLLEHITNLCDSTDNVLALLKARREEQFPWKATITFGGVGSNEAAEFLHGALADLSWFETMARDELAGEGGA